MPLASETSHSLNDNPLLSNGVLMKPLLLFLLCFLANPAAFAAEADGDFWYFQTSVYTNHWRNDPDHNNHQELIGVERNLADRSLWGGATFLNSFDQRTYYLYYGRRWVSEDYPVYLKLSGGFIQGYKGEYEDKIPLNGLGVAPVLIPSVGAHFGPVGAELVVLGTAAIMVNVGVRY